MAQLSWQELYDLAARHGAGPGADLCCVVAADAESGRDPYVAPGDAGASWGLWQLNQNGGEGQGYDPDQLRDPDFAAEIMVPIFNANYQDGITAGYTGEELVRYCCMWSERPAGTPNLHAPAMDRYAASWYAAVAALSGEAPPVNDLVAQWIAAMEALTGTPYVFGGKNVARDGGLDCSGLVTSTARTVGLDLGDPDMTSADGLKAYCDPVAENDARRGDVVLFSQTYGDGGPDYATHVGVWLSPGRMIDTHDGVHETNLYEPYWQQHLIGFWRPRGLAGDGENGGEDLSADEKATLAWWQGVAPVLPGFLNTVEDQATTLAQRTRGQNHEAAAAILAQLASFREVSGYQREAAEA